VDAKASVARDNAAVSSARTMEQSPAAEAGGPSLGSRARRALPSAPARSAFAFPWAVPGRSEEPAAGSSPAAATLDVSAAAGLNKGPREGSGGPGAAVPPQGADKTPSRAPEPQHAQPEGQHAAARPRAVTLLDRIFGLDKGKDGAEAAGEPHEGRQELDIPTRSATERGPTGSAANGIDDCNQKDLGQDSAGAQGPAAAAPGKAEVEQDSPQAAAGQSSVMSFLKTLCSPPPALAPKGSKADRGQPAPKAAAESPSKGAKKKKAESPKLGHSTFSKLFRHKAAKETQQTTNTKSPEQPAVPSVKPDRSVPPCQEAAAKQNPRAAEAAAPAPGASAESPRDGSKDKGSAPPLPLSKLFWKKNSSEEAEAVSNEKAEVALEAVAPDRDESKSPEAAEVKPRGAESKTPKANLRKFFKLTLNATERPESEPGGQKSKEGCKEKKGTAEVSKKGGREAAGEQPQPREQPPAQPGAVHNGGDASKEPPHKKMEKRQSLGGFFKGL
ncbi:BCAS1 protein, partial [Climacteris rufus]|nr:BCAS1 protein [Climacteris rufus]